MTLGIGETSIIDWQKYIHKWAINKGFYIYRTSLDLEHVSGSPMAMLMLIVTEVAELAESLRHEDRDNEIEEAADIAIRLFDYCEFRGIHLEEAIANKMVVNEKRPHKLTERKGV